MVEKIENDETMNVLFQAGSEVQRIMQSKKWPFCFIGGLAVIRWGEIRITQDIDVSLWTGFVREENYIDSLLSIFTPSRSLCLFYIKRPVLRDSNKNNFLHLWPNRRKISSGL